MSTIPDKATKYSSTDALPTSVIVNADSKTIANKPVKSKPQPKLAEQAVDKRETAKKAGKPTVNPSLNLKAPNPKALEIVRDVQMYGGRAVRADQDGDAKLSRAELQETKSDIAAVLKHLRGAGQFGENDQRRKNLTLTLGLVSKLLSETDSGGHRYTQSDFYTLPQAAQKAILKAVQMYEPLGFATMAETLRDGKIEATELKDVAKNAVPESCEENRSSFGYERVAREINERIASKLQEDPDCRYSPTLIFESLMASEFERCAVIDPEHAGDGLEEAYTVQPKERERLAAAVKEFPKEIATYLELPEDQHNWPALQAMFQLPNVDITPWED